MIIDITKSIFDNTKSVFYITNSILWYKKKSQIRFFWYYKIIFWYHKINFAISQNHKLFVDVTK